MPYALGERPKWIEKTPRAPQHVYYVGRAVDAKTEKLGIELATQDAYQQAIRENFGILTRISRQSTETLKSTEYSKTFQELSKDVRIIRFTQEEKYLEKTRNNRALNVWVLFKYPREEIARERQRLHKINFEKKGTIFSVQGSPKDKLKGALEIVTEPEDATVSIDGESWGRTPLRIVGKLASGKHVLELVKTNYKRMKRDIIIIPGKVERIEEKLVRGLGKLKIVTVPHSANVAINGKRVGLSPTVFVELESGIPHKVEISHAETHPMSFDTELGLGENKAQEIKLSYRPSYLNLNIPAGANAFLNGELLARNQLKGKQLTPHQEHEIEVEKERYRPHSQTVFLKGGETKNLSIALARENDTIEDEQEDTHLKNINDEARKLIQYFAMGFGLGLGGDTVKYFSGAWNPMFVFQSGRILGAEGRLTLGTTRTESNYSLVKAKVLLKVHPNASEIYTAEVNPELLPIAGAFGNIGAGLVWGQAEAGANGQKINFRTLVFPVGLGYDFASTPVSVSIEHNIYLKIPQNSIDFQLKSDTVLSGKFKFAF